MIYLYEDLKHSLLDCLQLQTKIIRLQWPRQENEEGVIGEFLFEDEENKEEIKYVDNEKDFN